MLSNHNHAKISIPQAINLIEIFYSLIVLVRFLVVTMIHRLTRMYNSQFSFLGTHIYHSCLPHINKNVDCSPIGPDNASLLLHLVDFIFIGHHYTPSRCILQSFPIEIYKEGYLDQELQILPYIHVVRSHIISSLNLHHHYTPSLYFHFRDGLTNLWGTPNSYYFAT